MTRKKLRILALVTDAFGGHGGIALYMRDLLRSVSEIDEVGKILLLARKGQVDHSCIPSKVDWDTSALRGKPHFLNSLLKVVFGKDQPQIILCGHINLLPLAKLAALRSKAPILLFIYGIDAWTPPRNWLAAKMTTQVALVISISEITKQRFLAWSGLDANKVSLVPNAIKQGKYGPGPRNPELVSRYSLQGKLVLMTLGRLSAMQRHKGVDEVISVMPRLIKQFPNLVYLVVGGGDDVARLKRKTEQLGLQAKVVFTGFVHEQEKADYYRLADAFALTGHGDGFGFVLLEAMACGTPVIASVLDGTQEAVLLGELGTLVDPSNEDSLIGGISLALQKPKHVPQGLDHFSISKFKQRLNYSLDRVFRGVQ